MPCSSSHCEPTAREIELTKVYCVFDELNGLGSEPDKWKGGYHPKVYGQVISNRDADDLVAEACSRLGLLSQTALGMCSFELQMWWRDHQAADARRVGRDRARAVLEEKRTQGLAKLTREEKKALGL